MIGLPQKASLLHCPSGQFVEAKFVKLWRRVAEADIDAVWWSEIRKAMGKREQPEDDEHWRWGAIADEFWLRGGECVGLQTADRRIQGAMACRPIAATEAQEGSVYIGWIAAAPWNREWLFDPPAYRGAGTKLLLYAAARSYLLGLKGTLTLNAFPRPRTKAFYQARGFSLAGQRGDGTIAMVLSARKAMDWLQREGVVP